MAARVAVLAAVCLALAPVPRAGEANPAGDDDPAAAWLRHLRGCLANVHSLSARFTQDLVHPLGARGDEETGRLELRGGGRLRLDYDAPRRRQVASDGKVVRSWDPGSRLFVEQPVKGDLLSSAFAFVRGQGTAAGFAARFLGGAPQPVAGGGPGVIVLAPARAHRHFERAALVLEPTCPAVVRVVLTDRSGTATRFSFFEVRQNPGIGHRRFVLEPPAGVEVVRP